MYDVQIVVFIENQKRLQETTVRYMEASVMTKTFVRGQLRRNNFAKGATTILVGVLRSKERW